MRRHSPRRIVGFTVGVFALSLGLAAGTAGAATEATTSGPVTVNGLTFTLTQFNGALLPMSVNGTGQMIANGQVQTSPFCIVIVTQAQETPVRPACTRTDIY